MADNVAPLARQDMPTRAELAIQSGNQIADLLRHGIDRGLEPAQLKELADLYRDMQKDEAAREFAAAFADFQRRCPSVPRTSSAKVVSKRTGTSFGYTYAELDEIAACVNPILGEVKLSYTWDVTEVKDNVLHCTCILRHANGHEISAGFPAIIDTEAHMNKTQQVGAALTYAKRQSLSQVLGLTTTDPDTDANPIASEKRIDEEQANRIHDMLIEVDADKSLFLAWLKQAFGVERISDLSVDYYDSVVAKLKQKKRQAKT